MRNKLLSNIYFGSELDKLGNYGKVGNFLDLPQDQQDQNLAFVRKFFKQPLRGVFGGPITAGDALFILHFLSAIRPAAMMEVGVCSGFSSAFLLRAAAWLGLAKGDTFLYSYDLLERHGKDLLQVGRVVEMNNMPEKEFWQLSTGMTLPDLVEGKPQDRPDCGMIFIDANHQHPWPLLDILSADHLLSPGSWILMQDVQVMERWFANSIEYGVPCPRPCRGVHHVAVHWPLEKHFGVGPCYNMVALKSGLSVEQNAGLVAAIANYPDEIGVRNHADVMLRVQGLLSLDQRG
jgi:predicted O-methyltransferase YrrM